MRFIIATLAFGLMFSLGANADVRITNNDVVHQAAGDLLGAASAGQENAYVSCDLSGAYLNCSASDGLGQYAACYTDDFRYKQLFPSMGKTATIVFFWDVDGRCASVEVENRNEPYSPRAATAIHNEIAIGVESASRYAYGTTNAPHDSGERLSCKAGQDYIACTATNKNGVVEGCSTDRDSAWQTVQDMITAVSGINEGSYVFFQWDDTPQKRCTSVYVSNASYYMP